MDFGKNHGKREETNGFVHMFMVFSCVFFTCLCFSIRFFHIRLGIWNKLITEGLIEVDLNWRHSKSGDSQIHSPEDIHVISPCLGQLGMYRRHSTSFWNWPTSQLTGLVYSKTLKAPLVYLWDLPF